MIKRYLKAFVNSYPGRKLMGFIDRMKGNLFHLLSKSGRLGSIYYFLFSGAFDREYMGVMNGIIRYQRELQSDSQSYYLLRRNTHRLEKGLLMKPRRNIFALDYISETVDCYERAIKSHSSNPDNIGELRWAHDVLTVYFEVTGSHPIIDEARCKFNSLRKLQPPCEDGVLYVPYKRNLSSPAPVNYEQLLELARRRRSVRWYLPKAVPRELIDKAIEVASLSPSACNRQPFVFRVFADPEMVQKVASIPGGTSGYQQNIPVIIVVVGRLRAFANERDRHLIYIDGSLAAMSLMFALETLGLSSCGINWPDLKTKEKQMASLIGLEPDERVIMLISVGYPDPEGLVAFSQKKELDLIRKYN